MPSPTPTVSVVATGTNSETLTDALTRDLNDLAVRLRGVSPDAITKAMNDAPKPKTVGETEVFWVSDQIEDRLFQVATTLALITGNVYWYVDAGVNIPGEVLQQVANDFEQTVRPAIVSAIGDIRKPGIDGDPRLTVLITKLNGLGGYFGAGDSYSRVVHPDSNEREMMYMDADYLLTDPDEFLAILAHEFQHAVHANIDPDEDSWINEGFSELAREFTTSPSAFVDFFAAAPGTQLTFWPDASTNTTPHYGAAILFLDYLFDRYGGTDGFATLANIQADGIEGVEEYLSSFGVTFDDVFGDWIVANYLDAPDGPYAHLNHDFTIRQVLPLTSNLPIDDSTPQHSASYYRLRLENNITVSFAGDTEVAQVAARCHSGERCWWSGVGDSMDARLTRAFDLRGLGRATLDFWTYHDIEEGWDYAYVTASSDAGRTWRVLQGNHTTAYDPVGNALGIGYTGRSSGWVNERIDLSPYAGKEILVRFEYVTDEAVYLDGLLLNDIAIPELGFFDDAESPAGWHGEGFRRITTTLPQRFVVQLIQRFTDGTTDVFTLSLDENNTTRFRLEDVVGRIEEAILVIAPITRGTHQPARYRLSIAPFAN
ncbi:MAG: immune inhibitor A [Chloroflexi bacterium]|nr:immune inhibitor A [Chloroflexota bacterium]